MPDVRNDDPKTPDTDTPRVQRPGNDTVPVSEDRTDEIGEQVEEDLNEQRDEANQNAPQNQGEEEKE